MNTPFLAVRSMGTVRFVQCMAEAEPINAAAAVERADRTMMQFEFNESRF